MKKLIVVAVIVVGVVAVFIAIGVWCAGAAKKMIEERRHNIAGLALDIGGYEASLARAELKLERIRIYPAGHEDEKSLLTSADELTIRVAPLDLLRGALHARKITLKGPSISYVITGIKSSNWDVLSLGDGSKKKVEESGVDKKSKSKSWPITVDKIEIEHGAVAYRDQVKGSHLDLENVDISVENIKAAARADELPTSFKLKANAGKAGGVISVAGSADVFGDGISFDLTGGLASTPITTFASFYAGSVSLPVMGGSIAVTSRARAQKDRLISTYHATISGLKVGGGIKGDVLNKFVLSQSGPIGVDTSVNGDLSSGDFSVSTAVSKGFFDELTRRSVAAAPEMALGKLKELAPVPAKAIPFKIEKGIKGLFKKR
ncbi:MAG: AsmA family protein [Pseudomonadota bacterium]